MENIRLIKKTFKDIYNLEVFEVSLIVDQGRKKVWEIATSKGKKIWKSMPLSKDMICFIVKVTEYLIAKGLKVPPVTKTRSGKDYYLSPQGEIYLLTDWIEGTKPSFTNHMKDIVITLAKFHKYTARIDMSSYSYVPDRRGSWPTTYQNRQKRLYEINKVVDKKSKAARGFLKNIDYFLNKTKTATVLLEKSYYRRWLQKKGTKTGLCHRDFIPQNLRLSETGELYVFDFDTLTIDLPAMDLRKIINSICKEKGKWDIGIVKSVIAFYNSVNPLSLREWEVVFIDLMYPHFFYSLVNNYCINGINSFTDNCNFERLQNTIDYEKSKDSLWEDFRHIMK